MAKHLFSNPNNSIRKADTGPDCTSFLQNKLITGTLLLTVTGIATKCIGFFYKIFLSRTIGAEGLGIYQLVLPLFFFALSICCGGIQTGISRYAAFCHAKKEARLYLYLGMTASCMLAVCCSVLLWQYAPPISAYLLQEPICQDLIRIMALAIPFACVHACINAHYYGLKKTAVPAITQLAEQGARVIGVAILFLILQESGQEITARPAIWGILIGEVCAVLISVTALRLRPAAGNLLHTAKTLFTFALPLTCNRIALSLAQSLENIMIPISLKRYGYSGSDALSLYGILTGMALASVMLPAVLSNSLSVMLLPEISRAQAAGQQDRILSLFRKTVSGSLILGFLCTLLFLCGGTFAGTHLFHNHLAGVYIKTLSWICPFLFLGSTLCSILQGLGAAKTILCNNLLASLIRIFFVIAITPIIGIKGYLWGILLSQLLSASLAYNSLKRRLFAKP